MHRADQALLWHVFNMRATDGRSSAMPSPATLCPDGRGGVCTEILNEAEQSWQKAIDKIGARAGLTKGTDGTWRGPKAEAA